MMFSRSPRIAAGLTAAVSLLALQASPALAFDPSGNEIADAFLSLLDAEKGTVESYGSVDEAGGAVTLSDIVISKEDEEGASVTIASTVLTGGEIQADGRLKLASLDMSNLQLTAEDGGMSLADLKVTELLLPTPEEAASDTPPVGPGYKTFEANSIQIRDEDNQIADIAKISSSIDAMDGDLPTAGSFAVTGATIDVKELESKETKSLTDLGYETLTVDVAGSGKWDPEAATLVVPELKIDAKEAASLSLSFSMGGVTREVVTQLNEKSEKPEEAMALLQNVTIENAKIRLDDASLTGRVLDQESKKAGVDTPTYVAGLTGTLPMMLGMLQNKELEGKVAQAVTQFLNTPGSLELTAAPGAPVPLSQIMGTAMFAPQMIPQILSVGITANQ
ncbi:hypothetical protein FIV06_23100 [Labrenzia sp. THAF191b]|jgi:hypothetical protein|uniref:hypothetical protein n=1 Tax=unclassified Labrenzia TaxID=2648686 RepID=UPI0012AA1BE9|nr:MULTISPECIES: hypothetical protein [unclassified Labrenzia]QFT00334.1 hypothetical protein FIV06_23100 [Labrenzia sp. THAF191b]QFT06647.1 hypothetical protein FIV05_23095 [Labrenzia sp. THAF191a]QFT18191.1 hypothetical protein FIV03_23110 [Labrenzia sp. THAF187b]